MDVLIHGMESKRIPKVLMSGLKARSIMVLAG